MQEYARFSLQLGSDEAEVLSADLFSLECNGITETTPGTCDAFFPADELTIAAVRELLEEKKIKYTAKREQNRDWNAEWKKSFKPFYFTPHTVIRPGWIQNELPCAREIIIEPKMTFGTGTHESTQICGTLLERHAAHAGSMFDIGTGTGVLSILGSMLGVREVTACDTDPLSADNAPENFAANNRRNIRLFIGSVENIAPAFMADIVTINIIYSVIAALLPAIKNIFSQGMIFSGILIEEKDRFTGLLKEHGLVIKDEIMLHEWYGGLATHAGQE
jgi:ribosomal protein L11 methyltransferase